MPREMGAAHANAQNTMVPSRATRSAMPQVARGNERLGVSYKIAGIAQTSKPERATMEDFEKALDDAGAAVVRGSW